MSVFLGWRENRLVLALLAAALPSNFLRLSSFIYELALTGVVLFVTPIPTIRYDRRDP